MDIKLSTLDHDIEFDGSDFTLTQTESEGLAQRLRVKLKTFAGEWFLDVNEGIPYYESILGKRRAKETIDIIFQNAILEEPEVISLSSFESEITPQRIYKMRFTVRPSDGDEGIPVDLVI